MNILKQVNALSEDSNRSEYFLLTENNKIVYIAYCVETGVKLFSKRINKKVAMDTNKILYQKLNVS